MRRLTARFVSMGAPPGAASIGLLLPRQPSRRVFTACPQPQQEKEDRPGTESL
jgi:hypothetical protein